ncbi:MAG TPA: alpha/beta hydrolase [Acidimicrobiales bacterium]|nr:alpha/beta hydrolase [Acidimicrobiales bacterium]
MPDPFTPLVLVHGGSFAGSCWDLVVTRLRGPVLAVDLPGRGVHPAPLDSLTIAAAAESVAADIDAAGFDDVVLVGHSLAGCSMPTTIGLLGDRVLHAVFVACTVPENGKSCLDTLPSEVKAMVREDIRTPVGVLDEASAKAFFGSDLDQEQFKWCRERMVPEGLDLVLEPVDLTPLRSPFPRTWVRTLRDAIIDPEDQLRYAENAGNCEIIDMDAGHMCMISKPAELATLLNELAASSRRSPA